MRAPFIANAVGLIACVSAWATAPISLTPAELPSMPRDYDYGSVTKREQIIVDDALVKSIGAQIEAEEAKH